MSWLNVLNEIRENTKSAQTRSQVNVKYISARNGSSGPPTENPFQTTNLSTKAGPIANTAILVIRAMRICRVWLRETHFEVVKKRNHCKGYLVWTRMIWALNCPVLLFFKRTNYFLLVPTSPRYSCHLNSDSVGGSGQLRAYQCKECLKWYSTKRTLREHTPSHHGKTKCQFCNKIFSTVSCRNKHVKKVHSEQYYVNLDISE